MQSTELNERETKIAILAGRGFLYKEIADQLGLTEHQVKEQAKRARAKTKTRNIAHLAVLVAVTRKKMKLSALRKPRRSGFTKLVVDADGDVAKAAREAGLIPPWPLPPAPEGDDGPPEQPKPK